MGKEITTDEAKALYESKFWEGMTPQAIAEFQLYQPRLCMPFQVFHKAVETTLGRPVWTHEFAFADLLKAELRGDRPPPTLAEILDLVPADKRILLLMESP